LAGGGVGPSMLGANRRAPDARRLAIMMKKKSLKEQLTIKKYTEYFLLRINYYLYKYIREEL